MTVKQVEERMTELVHREPFVPFVVEMTNGAMLEVPHAGVAFDDAGAVFIGPEGGLVEFEFDAIRGFRLQSPEKVA